MLILLRKKSDFDNLIFRTRKHNIAVDNIFFDSYYKLSFYTCK